MKPKIIGNFIEGYSGMQEPSNEGDLSVFRHRDSRSSIKLFPIKEGDDRFMLMAFGERGKELALGYSLFTAELQGGFVKTAYQSGVQDSSILLLGEELPIWGNGNYSILFTNTMGYQTNLRLMENISSAMVRFMVGDLDEDAAHKILKYALLGAPFYLVTKRLQDFPQISIDIRYE
jgi:hypothetical protein